MLPHRPKGDQKSVGNREPKDDDQNLPEDLIRALESSRHEDM